MLVFKWHAIKMVRSKSILIKYIAMMSNTNCKVINYWKVINFSNCL